MKVLVLGGYGLIGSAVVDRLLDDGHEVVGLGRDVCRARRARPQAGWIAADMAELTTAEHWLPFLKGLEAIVNAAGALQHGGRDDLDAVHRRSIEALVDACERARVALFVQISAVGADPGSPQPFFSTKGAGDAAVTRSGLHWTILRPGLVIAPAAYGGTALLRALSAFPGFIPAVMADRPIQSVDIRDVAEAVSLAIGLKLPPRLCVDLVEDRSRPLADVLCALRAWLGLAPAPVVAMPAIVGRAGSALADLLGRLGWRSPLRSAALSALAQGVTGDPAPWREATGMRLASLEQTLARMPSTVQERWFARMWLMKPLVVGCLSLFWLLSGIIGLARMEEAATILTSRGIGENAARFAVVAGGLADIAVGAAVLVRRWAKPALWGMVAITCFYLAAATVVAPDLWLDPLGALVKTLPALCLALIGLAILDER